LNSLRFRGGFFLGVESIAVHRMCRILQLPLRIAACDSPVLLPKLVEVTASDTTASESDMSHGLVTTSFGSASALSLFTKEAAATVMSFTLFQKSRHLSTRRSGCRNGTALLFP